VTAGKEYIKLAQKSNGSVFDLCEKNWNSLLDKLSKAIVGRNRSFKLKSVPNSEQEIKVIINGVELTKDQFTLDAATGTVSIAPTVVLPPGPVDVEIRYAPAT
jgi:hypothetical protein